MAGKDVANEINRIEIGQEMWKKRHYVEIVWSVLPLASHVSER